MNIIGKIINRFHTQVHRLRYKVVRFLMPRLTDLDNNLLSLLVSPRMNLEGLHDENISTLIKISLSAAETAHEINLDDLSNKIVAGEKWPDIWPGEHYRLLAAIVKNQQPKLIVEIGTFLGLSAIAMKEFLPVDGTIETFDLIPWDFFDDTVLTKEDVSDGRLQQKLGDLSDENIFNEHKEMISKADLIFIDGPKNREFERSFLRLLNTVSFQKTVLLVIDDIKLWNMLDIWNAIKATKLDLTSFGHFTGTGLVILNPGYNAVI